MFALRELGGDASTGVVRPLPDQQKQQARDAGECEPLQCQADRPGAHAATMKTVVPIWTRLKSHSASGIRIRMQPWEAE